jgi:hypothetical protein
MYDPGDEDTFGVRTTGGPNMRSSPGGIVRPNSAASSLNLAKRRSRRRRTADSLSVRHLGSLGKFARELMGALCQ